MNYKKNIYEDEYYKIFHHEKFSNVPGMVIIKPKLENWYSIDAAIERANEIHSKNGGWHGAVITNDAKIYGNKGAI